MSMRFGSLKVIQGCVCYAAEFNLERDFSVFVSHLAEDVLTLLQRYIDVAKAEKTDKFVQIFPSSTVKVLTYVAVKLSQYI